MDTPNIRAAEGSGQSESALKRMCREGQEREAADDADHRVLLKDSVTMPVGTAEIASQTDQNISSAEAAALLEVSRNTLNRLKRDGDIVPVGVHRNTDLYSRAAIEVLVERRATTRRFQRSPVDNTPHLMTSAQAATLLGVSWRTLDRLRASGAVTSSGSNRSFRYTRESVEALHQRRLEGEPDFVGAELCACNCGNTIITGSRSRYLPGHHARLNDQLSIRGVAVKRRYPKPPTELGQFLRDKWQASGLPLRTYAESFVGIGHSQFRSYLQGVRPQDRVLVRLRAVYPDLPEIESYSDTLRDRARKNLRDGAYQATRTRESLDKMAASQRGRVVPKEVIDKAQETRKTSEAWAEHMEKTKSVNRSVPNRAARILTWQIKRYGTPDQTTLKQWASNSADRLGITAEAVIALWKKTRPELWPASGRRKLLTRHDAITRLLKDQGWPHSGPIPAKFWESALEELQRDEHEGKKAPGTGDSLRVWWVNYERTCPDHMMLRPAAVKKLPRKAVQAVGK